MSPTKQRFVGLAGCQWVVGRSSYHLPDGKTTVQLALTRSLVLAEPSLRKYTQGAAISCEAAAALGYQVARTYDDAANFGLV